MTCWRRPASATATGPRWSAAGAALTYGELLDAGARLANALRGAGVAPGTPVAAMLEDRLDSLVVYVGAAIGGYPVIHVNDRLAAPEVAHILRDSGARVLFHTDGRSEVVAAAAGETAPLLVTIGGQRPPGALDSTSSSRRQRAARGRRRAGRATWRSSAIPAAPPACPRGR